MLGDNQVAEVKVPAGLSGRAGSGIRSWKPAGVQGQRAVDLTWRLRLDVLPKSRCKDPPGVPSSDQLSLEKLSVMQMLQYAY